MASAQVRIFGYNATNGKPVNIEVVLGSGVHLKSNNSEPGIVVVNYRGIKEVLIKADGFQEYRKQINGEVSGKHNIALLPLSNLLDGVIVTDVYSSRTSKNTVLNISKISSKKIEELGAFDLRDALSYENNIRISRDNALGSAGLTLMGVGGDNVKFLVDGVPVIGRMFNQLDLEQFNLENTKQIEIIKGPMSVIYGSNALAGSINIITSASDTKSKLSVNTNYETDGQYNVSATGAKSFGNHSFTLTGGRMFFDGWSRFNTDRTFDWIPKEQYTARVQYVYTKDDAQISFRSEALRSFLLDRGTPILPYEETAVDQKYLNRRYDNSLSYSNKIGKTNLQLISSNNSFNRIKNKYYKNLVTLQEDLVPIVAEQDTQTFNASVFRTIVGLDKEKTKGIETLLGLDANYEFGTGNRIKNNQQSILDAALFLSAEKQFTSYLLVRGGLRYAYNSSFNSPLIYSLQTKFNFPHSQILKVAYGKGFRAPSLKELFLDFNDSRHEVFGNENLMAEESHSFTTSYTKYYTYEDLEFSSTIDGFYNHIINKIELLVAGPIQAKYGNIGLFESLGGEYNQKVVYNNLKLNTSFTYTGTFNGVEGDKRDFNFSPQVVIQPGISIKKTKTDINVFFNYFGALQRVFSDTTSDITSVQMQDPYSMMDVSVSQVLLKKRLRVSAGLRNLFNVVNINSQMQEVGAHTPSTSFVSISPGRTFFISARYEIFKQ